MLEHVDKLIQVGLARDPLLLDEPAREHLRFAVGVDGDADRLLVAAEGHIYKDDGLLIRSRFRVLARLVFEELFLHSLRLVGLDTTSLGARGGPLGGGLIFR